MIICNLLARNNINRLLCEPQRDIVDVGCYIHLVGVFLSRLIDYDLAVFRPLDVIHVCPTRGFASLSCSLSRGIQAPLWLRCSCFTVLDRHPNLIALAELEIFYHPPFHLMPPFVHKAHPSRSQYVCNSESYHVYIESSSIWTLYC